MPAPPDPAPRPPAGRRDRLAALLAEIALLAAVTAPFFTILSRGIAPVLLAVCFFGLVLWALLSGRLGAGWRLFLSMMASPAGLAGAALMVLLLASTAWSAAPARGLEMAGQSVIAVLGVVGVLACLRLRGGVPAASGLLVGGVLAVAAAALLVELGFGSPLRASVGANTDPSRLNRAAVAVVLMLPAALVPLLLRGGRGRLAMAGGLSVLVGAAAFASISESAKLAFLVMAGLAAVQAASERAARIGLGVAMVASLVAIPFAAPWVNPLIPQTIQEAVGPGTLYVRGEIWTAFAQLVSQAPLFGHGAEASHVAQQAHGAQVPPHLFMALGFGHPHNAALQVWYELGLAGVLLSAALLAALVAGIGRLKAPFRQVATLLAAGVWAITFVSHGAWQAWWWALVGLALVVLVSEIGVARRRAR